MIKSTTKYAEIVKDPKLIKYHLEKAYHLSMEGRPGPVWLDIPANIQNANINTKELKGFKVKKINKKNQKLNNKIKKDDNMITMSERTDMH